MRSENHDASVTCQINMYAYVGYHILTGLSNALRSALAIAPYHHVAGKCSSRAFGTLAWDQLRVRSTFRSCPAGSPFLPPSTPVQGLIYVLIEAMEFQAASLINMEPRRYYFPH